MLILTERLKKQFHTTLHSQDNSVHYENLLSINATFEISRKSRNIGKKKLL